MQECASQYSQAGKVRGREGNDVAALPPFIMVYSCRVINAAILVFYCYPLVKNTIDLVVKIGEYRTQLLLFTLGALK